MSANTSPIFPGTPVSVSASLAAVTACATRAPMPIANIATNNLVLLSDVSTNGRRVDKITVRACSSSMTSATVAGIVQIWESDGVTVWLRDEIAINAVTPSTTSPAFSTSVPYSNLVLPSSHKLYVATTVTTTASTNALEVTADGGDY